jgi:hypothetical protein
LPRRLTKNRGQEFESLRARHFEIRYRRRTPPILRLELRRHLSRYAELGEVFAAPGQLTVKWSAEAASQASKP